MATNTFTFNGAAQLLNLYNSGFTAIDPSDSISTDGSGNAVGDDASLVCSYYYDAPVGDLNQSAEATITVDAQLGAKSSCVFVHHNPTQSGYALWIRVSGADIGECQIRRMNFSTGELDYISAADVGNTDVVGGVGSPIVYKIAAREEAGGGTFAIDVTIDGVLYSDRLTGLTTDPAHAGFGLYDQDVSSVFEIVGSGFAITTHTLEFSEEQTSANFATGMSFDVYRGGVTLEAATSVVAVTTADSVFPQYNVTYPNGDPVSGDSDVVKVSYDDTAGDINSTGVVRTGTAQAGAATTITLDADASGSDDTYNTMTITLTGGTGSGQSRTISDYVGSTKVATVSAWATNPDSTSTFSIDNGNAGQALESYTDTVITTC